MAKQDKSKFQLNKGTNHSFDISKGGKRKFDLSKDDEESVVENVATPKPTASVNTPLPTPEPDEKKSNKWLWIILAIIAIILLIWWILPGKTTETETVIEEDSIEEVTVPADTTENVSDDAKVPAGEEAIEENANNEEASTPSVSGANTPEATPAPQDTDNNVTTPAPSAVSNDIEAEALRVIRGEYGIGQDRKNKLGSQYQDIQRRVNELKREGAF